MKSRSREVNIFNMSLLDILCGALGAFCFMMLVLMPSYQKAAGSSDDVQQLKMAKEKAEQQAQEAQAEAEQAKQKQQQAEGKLDVAKRPMVVEIQWNNPEDEVNMYVRFKGKDENGREASGPAFNPEVRPQATYAGDNWFTWGNHEFWVIRDAPVAEYEIYYRIAKRSPQKQPIFVSGVFGSSGSVGLLPSLTLDGTQKGVFVGTIVRTADQKLTFRGKGDR